MKSNKEFLRMKTSVILRGGRRSFDALTLAQDDRTGMGGSAVNFLVVWRARRGQCRPPYGCWRTMERPNVQRSDTHSTDYSLSAATRRKRKTPEDRSLPGL